MIELHNISSGYGEDAVIRNLSLTFRPGEITVIIGPNGCGKSTLLKTIVGILPLSEGEILLNGIPAGQLSTVQRARQVAYLPQNHRTPDISVLQLVLHGRFPHLTFPRRYRPADTDAARRAIRRMGLEKWENQPVNRLSGGMQQKAYIAMALAQEAETILMDEPTTFLDAAHQLQTMETARLLAREGKAVVMVLHDISLALRTADTIAVMEQGCLRKTGTPEEIFQGGLLPEVFGVEIQRCSCEDGWQYFCRLPRK